MFILIAVLALSFMIFIHEFGHFISAKLSGIKVLEFSIFMGPKLFSFGKGETQYSLRAIPIGGYVKMEGEEEDSEDKRAYCRQPVWKRAIVAAAGSVVNIIAGIIIYAILFAAVANPSNIVSTLETDSPSYLAGIREGDEIVEFQGKAIRNYMDLQIHLFVENEEDVNVQVKREDAEELLSFNVLPEKLPTERYSIGIYLINDDNVSSNVVEEVIKGSGAEKAGLLAGDEIVKMNEAQVSNIEDIGNFIDQNKANDISTIVIRNGEEVSLIITPKVETQPEMYDIGVMFYSVKQGIFKSIGSAFTMSFSVVKSVIYSIGWLIQGKVSIKDTMGPIGIVSTIGQAVNQRTFVLGLISFFNILAFLSINLGVMNLMPFPALDGSKLVMLLIEKIRGKAISMKKESMIFVIGFVILMLFMVFTLFNDAFRIFGG